MASTTVAGFQRPILEDPAQQIRLLRFLPIGGTSQKDTIQCKLSVHDIDQVQGTYVAISYTWGDEAQTRPIWVNGCRLRVRYNCWYALWQMRLHAPSEAYWIDSICIDQECHSEKTFQVAQMGAIYSRAQYMAACIGQPGPDLDLFVCLSIWRQAATEEKVAKAVDRAYHALSERSYFRRLWTVQECLFACRILVHWGEMRVSWAELWEHWQWQDMKSRGASDPQVGGSSLSARDNKAHQSAITQSYSMSPMEKLKAFAADCAGSEADTSADGFLRTTPVSQSQLGIAKAVIRYSSRECCDPHDKLYGLLPLASPAFRNLISMDYDKNLFQVLCDYISAFNIAILESEDEFWTIAWSIKCLAGEFSKVSREFLHDLEQYTKGIEIADGPTEGSAPVRIDHDVPMALDVSHQAPARRKSPIGTYLSHENEKVWLKPRPSRSALTLPLPNTASSAGAPYPGWYRSSQDSFIHIGSSVVSKCWKSTLQDAEKTRIAISKERFDAKSLELLGFKSLLDSDDLQWRKELEIITSQFSRARQRLLHDWSGKNILLVGGCVNREMYSALTMAFEVPDETRMTDSLVAFSCPLLDLNDVLLVLRPDGISAGDLVHVVGPAKFLGQPFAGADTQTDDLGDFDLGQIRTLCHCRKSSRLTSPVHITVTLLLSDIVLAAAFPERERDSRALLGQRQIRLSDIGLPVIYPSSELPRPPQPSSLCPLQ